MKQAEIIPLQLMAGGQITDVGEAACKACPWLVSADCCDEALDQRFEAKSMAYQGLRSFIQGWQSHCATVMTPADRMQRL